ncbi:MAG: RHS repeat protein [Aquincola sp.]|nr:RHS repeat protein [Aquincola sp.]
MPGLNLSTSSSYDRLNRRKDSTDPRSKTTLFEYNGRDDLTKVTDPRSLITEYPRNGLGEATALISPDTGATQNTYDAAGNLKTRRDSRGVLASYSYDALNRLSSVVYSHPSEASHAVTWNYDQTGAGSATASGD